MEPTWRNPDITEQVEAFMADLPQYPDQPTRAIVDAVDYVAEHGPAVGSGRIIDAIKMEPDYRAFVPLFGHRLREIRPLGTSIRILAIFGPDRTLVLLYAGDKEGDWSRWYRRAIPEAARLYAEYLRDTGQGS